MKKESSTPSEMVYDYLKSMAPYLVAASVMGGVICKASLFLTALTKLQNVYHYVTGKVTDKLKAKGVVKRTNTPDMMAFMISNDPLIVGRDVDLRYMVMDPRNFEDKEGAKFRPKLYEEECDRLIEQLKKKGIRINDSMIDLSETKSSKNFQKLMDNMNPSMKKKDGYYRLSKRLLSAKVLVPQGPPIELYKYQPEYLTRLTTMLRNIGGTESIKSLSLYSVSYEHMCYYVLAENQAHVLNTLDECGPEMTIADVATNVKEFLTDYAGELGVMLAVFVGIYLYFYYQTYEKIQIKEKYKGTNVNYSKVEPVVVTTEVNKSTKGTNIAAARRMRADNDYKNIIKQRTQIVRDLTRLQAQQHKFWTADDDNEIDIQKMKDLSDKMYVLNGTLAGLNADIQKIYDRELGAGASRTNKNQKNTGTYNRSLPGKTKKAMRAGLAPDNKGEARVVDLTIPDEVKMCDSCYTVEIKNPAHRYCGACFGKRKREPEMGEVDIEKKCKTDGCTKATVKSQDYCRTCYFSKDTPCKFGDKCRFGDACRNKHANKEAMVSNKGVVDSRSRQIEAKEEPIIPLYIYDQGKKEYKFTAFCTIGKLDGELLAITAAHVCKPGVYFKNSKGLYETIQFKAHPNPKHDLAVCNRSNLLKGQFVGKVFEISDSDKFEGSLTFYTRTVRSDGAFRPAIAVCDGYKKDGKYCHDADSYPGQCGSVYTEKRRIKYVHAETDNLVNIGYAASRSYIEDCLKGQGPLSS